MKAPAPTVTGPKLRDTCSTCAASKVKCDKQRPTCSRCLQRGIHCHYPLSKRVPRNYPLQQYPYTPRYEDPGKSGPSSKNSDEGDSSDNDFNSRYRHAHPHHHRNNPITEYNYTTHNNSGTSLHKPRTCFSHGIDDYLNDLGSSEMLNVDTLGSFPYHIAPSPTTNEIYSSLASASMPDHDHVKTRPGPIGLQTTLLTPPTAPAAPNFYPSPMQDATFDWRIQESSQTVINSVPSESNVTIPSTPPKLDCFCVTIALEHLVQLSTPGFMDYQLRRDRRATTHDVDTALDGNKEVVCSIDRILQCACVRNHSVFTTLVLVTSKLIDRYAATAVSSLASTKEPSTLPIITTPCSIVSRASSESGSPDTNSPLTPRVAIQYVLAELHHVQRIVGQLSHLAVLETGGGRDGEDSSLLFASTTLRSMTADLRRQLRAVSSRTIRILQQC